MSDLRDRVWRLRQEVARYKSQKDFAEAVGYNQSSVSRTLNADPPDEKQIAYLEYLVAKRHQEEQSAADQIREGRLDEPGFPGSEQGASVEKPDVPRPTILPAFVLQVGEHEILRVDLSVTGRQYHATIDMLKIDANHAG